MEPRKRWHAIQDALERAMRERDAAGVDDALAGARALRAEAPAYADYVDWLLFVAAEYGDLRAMRGLLDAGADLDAPNDDAGTALAAAVRYGRVEAVRLVLEAGADPRVVPARRDGLPPPLTPLMEAADTERVRMRRRAPAATRAAIVRLLLDAGAPPDDVVPDWTDAEPLPGPPDEETRADYRFVALAREGGGGERWVGFDNAITALSLTAEPEVVQMLLDAGADPDHEARSLPLFRAIREARPDTVRMLLARGARTDGLSPGRRRSPLREAADGESLAVVEALLDHGAELHGGEAVRPADVAPAMRALLASRGVLSGEA